MAIKFRLKGLAETFVDNIICPSCSSSTNEEGEDFFDTELSKVTLEGIVVVAKCQGCSHIFVPDGQRRGIINSDRLAQAVIRDSVNTGEGILRNRESVAIEVEKLNAEEQDKLQ